MFKRYPRQTEVAGKPGMFNVTVISTAWNKHYFYVYVILPQMARATNGPYESVKAAAGAAMDALARFHNEANRA
jgi:hypothetical protein